MYIILEIIEKYFKNENYKILLFKISIFYHMIITC